MTECEKSRRVLADRLRDCRELILAMGDETRQKIVLALLECEQPGLRVGEITRRTFLSRPAVSHHLKILKNAGIVTVRREGTRNYYFMSADETAWRGLHELSGMILETVRRAAESGYPQIDEEKENETWN